MDLMRKTKHGVSLSVLLLLCALGLFLRLLLPGPARALREVLWPDSAMERVYEVFAPNE